MRLLIIIASFWALVAAKPEMYKEKEDFQYSRSSSDDGTKSGFYGAQRGNMGGNYERAHNMDSLAQHQMSTLVRNVDGELGEGAKMRTGSVYSAANSRGLYGSGRYDLSNLRGRNFGENYLDSVSHSSMNNLGYSGYSDFDALYSAANNARYSNSQSQQSSGLSSGHQTSGSHTSGLSSEYQTSGLKNSGLSTGYQTSGLQTTGLNSGYQSSRSQNSGLNSEYQTSDLASQYSQIGEQHGVDSTYDASNYEHDIQSGSNYKYDKSGSFARSDSDNSNSASGYDYKTSTRLIHATPVRVYITPGSRVAIPVAAQVYDASANQGYNAVNSDSETLSTRGHRINYKPVKNAKHYESSYSYRKEWEKQDSIPAVAIVTTESPISTNNELYESQSLETANNEHESELASASSQSSRANGAYSNGYSASAKTALSSQSYNSGASASNAYTHNAYGTGTAANLYGSHISDGALNSNKLVEDIASKPKSYHSSYSYHKSWERRGDPYVIKPVGDFTEQNSRIRRSLNTNEYQRNEKISDGQEDMGQQSMSGWEQDLGQQPDSRWQNLADLGQETQNKWEDLGSLSQHAQSQLGNLEDLGQQTQNQWDKLENLGQQTQNQWGQLEDLSQQTQSKLEDLGQQTQNQWDKLENLGQQTQDQWGQSEDLSQQAQSKLEDLGQQTQNQWDKLENLGQQTQNQWGQSEDLSQQAQSKLEDLGQQTQNQWDKLENLGQQTQNQWGQSEDLSQQAQSKIEDLGQQTQNQWDKLENLGQQTLNQDQSDDLSQQAQPKLEDLGQQTQDQWDKLENLGQQALNQGDRSDDLTQQSQNQLNKLEDLSQQPQTQDKLQEIGQESQSQWSKLEDLGQKSQTQEQLADLGQHTQSHWGMFENLGQQTQNQWTHLGGFNQQTQNKLEDLGQQAQSHWGKLDNLGQNTQTHWNNLGDLSQQTQPQWGQFDDLRQQSQSPWGKLEELGQQTQNNWAELRQQSQTQHKFENFGQQTQSYWDNLGSLDQNTHNMWNNLNKQENLGQHPWNIVNFGQETQDYMENTNGGHQFYGPWTMNDKFVPFINYGHIPHSPHYHSKETQNHINNRWICHYPGHGSYFHSHNFDGTQISTDNSGSSFHTHGINHPEIPTENPAQNKDELLPKGDTNIESETTTVKYVTELEQIPDATTKVEVQVKSTTEVNRNPIDIGRGDIGPEDSPIETTINKKIPEIESLSLTKDEKDIPVEPLNLSVMDIDQQNEANKQNIWNQVSTVKELIRASTSKPITTMNIFSIADSTAQKSKFLSSSNNPVINDESQRKMSTVILENIGQQKQIQHFDQQNIDKYLKPIEEQQITQNLEFVRKPNIEQPSEPLEEQKLMHQLNNFEQENWGQETQSFDQQNMEQYLDTFEEQKIKQNIEPFKDQSIQHNLEAIEKQKVVQNLDLIVPNIRQPLKPLEEQQVTHQMNNFEHQNWGEETQQNIEQYLQPFTQENVRQLEPHKKQNVDLLPPKNAQLQDFEQKNSRQLDMPDNLPASLISHDNFGQQVPVPTDKNIKQYSETTTIKTSPQLYGQDQNKEPSKNTETTLIPVTVEPTTEKPGFWGSVWNKTKSAKNSIASWFSS